MNLTCRHLPPHIQITVVFISYGNAYLLTTACIGVLYDSICRDPDFIIESWNTTRTDKCGGGDLETPKYGKEYNRVLYHILMVGYCI